MAVYYNEIDAYAAEWLRNLMKEGLIPDGEVDTRSIVDVRPSDLRGFKQCHFFAGIAGWSHALRLAGWADDRAIWTGSCPCQPFSVAGKGKGTADERHLWPVFFDLIRKCRPAVVMGEQVASKAGRDWFSGVRSDLEDVGYAVGGADLCAAGVGAPHIRQRLWWVAVADAGGDGQRLGAERDREPLQSEQPAPFWNDADGRGDFCDLGHANDARLQGHGRSVEQHDAPGRQEPDGRSAATGVGDMADATAEFSAEDCRSYWRDAVWLTGADGKTRRSKPGVPLLVDGFPARASQLRAYGNAIVPPLAAEVIRAFMEVAP